MDARCHRGICLVVWWTLCVCTRLAVAQSDPDLCKSFVDAVKLNAESLERYDVLIEIIQNDGPLKEYTSWVRLKIDSPSELALMYRRSKNVQTTITDDDVIVESGSRSYSCLITGEQIAETDYIASPRIHRKGCFAGALESSNFLTIDRVGVEWFPVSKSSWGTFGSTKERGLWWSNLTQMLRDHARLRQSNAESTLVIEGPGSIPGRFYSHEFSFLADRLVPVSIVQRGRQKLESGGEQSQLIKREVFKWCEFEGLYLPVEVVRDELISVSGKAEEGTRITRLHWLSINTEIPASEFSTQWQSDPNRVLEQTQASLQERAIILEGI